MDQVTPFSLYPSDKAPGYQLVKEADTFVDGGGQALNLKSSALWKPQATSTPASRQPVGQR